MIIVAGLPASGKTTLAKKLGSNKKILEYDSIAKQFGSYEELNEEMEFANKHFNLLASTYQYDIIVDVFHTRQSRYNILSSLRCQPNLIYVRCPIEECIRRNALRSHSMVTNEEIKGLFYMFEPISIEEGFNKIFVYDSMADRLFEGDTNNEIL